MSNARNFRIRRGTRESPNFGVSDSFRFIRIIYELPTNPCFLPAPSDRQHRKMKTPGFVRSHIHQPCSSSWTTPISVSAHPSTARARWNRSSVSLNVIPFPDIPHSIDSFLSISPPSSSADSFSLSSVHTPLQRSVYDWISSQSASSSSSQLVSLSSNAASPTNPDRPPTKDEISLLQRAFADLYGTERNVAQAVDLLSQTITTWESTHQSGDEIAGLYRVRGDAYMVRYIFNFRLGFLVIDGYISLYFCLFCRSSYSQRMRSKIMARQLNTWMGWTETRPIRRKDLLLGKIIQISCQSMTVPRLW